MAKREELLGAELALAREAHRIELIQAYTRFLDCFVPAIGQRVADADQSPSIDEDLVTARTLACEAAFDAIRANALGDVARANARGKEASDDDRPQAGSTPGAQAAADA